MPAFSHTVAFSQAETRQRRLMVVLLSAMLGLLLACAWLLGGEVAMWAALALVTLGLGGITSMPVSVVMELHRAVPLVIPRRPDLTASVASLAIRAGLKATPTLYRLPGPGINALVVGRRGRAAIGISDGSLALLSSRELRAVLAHEVSHLAIGDTRLLALTCLISRITQGTAQIALGATLILVVVTNSFALSWSQILICALAVPVISLLQLALARNQEFAADLGAVLLTDDPIGLIAALERIETQDVRHGRLPRSQGHRVLHNLLRSHPAPRQRIARLLSQLYRAPPGLPSLAQPVFQVGQARTRVRWDACAGPGG